MTGEEKGELDDPWSEWAPNAPDPRWASPSKDQPDPAERPSSAGPPDEPWVPPEPADDQSDPPQTPDEPWVPPDPTDEPWSSAEPPEEPWASAEQSPSLDQSEESLRKAGFAIGTLAILILMIAAVLIGTQIGQSDDSSELATLVEEAREERDDLTEQMAALQSQVSDLTEQEMRLRDQLADATGDLRVVERQLGRAEQERDDAQHAAREAALDSITRQEVHEWEMRALEEEILLARQAHFGPEIRAEVARACSEAVWQWDVPISRILQWQEDWSLVAHVEEAIAVVEECSGPERARMAQWAAEQEAAERAAAERRAAERAAAEKEAAERRAAEKAAAKREAAEREAERVQLAADQEEARRAGCDLIDVDQLLWDPDALVGDCLLTYARIIQPASATGHCAFVGDPSSKRFGSSYPYEVEARFQADVPDPFDPSECPDLAEIDQGDIVKVFATVLGANRMHDPWGGTTVVPLFLIDRFELVAEG